MAEVTYQCPSTQTQCSVPEGFFSLYSTREEVLSAMGRPDGQFVSPIEAGVNDQTYRWFLGPKTGPIFLKSYIPALTYKEVAGRLDTRKRPEDNRNSWFSTVCNICEGEGGPRLLRSRIQFKKDTPQSSAGVPICSVCGSDDIDLGPDVTVMAEPIVETDRDYNLFVADPVEGKGPYIAGTFTPLSYADKGFKTWEYGDSKILFGPKPDCWWLTRRNSMEPSETSTMSSLELLENLGKCNCYKSDFVRGWFDTGNLKLYRHEESPLALLENEKLNYLLSPLEVLKTLGNPFLIEPETEPSPSKIDKTIAIQLETPLEEGGMRFHYGNLLRNNRTKYTPSVRKGKNDYFEYSVSPFSGYSTVTFSRNVQFTYDQDRVVYVRNRSENPEYDAGINIETAKELLWSKFPIIFEVLHPEEVISFKNIEQKYVADTSDLAQSKSILDTKFNNLFVGSMKLQDISSVIASAGSTATSPINSFQKFLSETANISSHAKGLKFEQYCQRLFEAMEYKVDHVGGSGDRGVDLKATKDGIAGNELSLIQCKHQPSVAADVVIQTLGMVRSENAKQGIVITTGTFTSDAKAYASENIGIQLIDGARLEELTKTHLG